MDYIVVQDTAIFAVNRGKKVNESSSIMYRDLRGRWHSIDFEICASNFKAEHETTSGNCIGERKMDEYYFIFYTSGKKQKLYLKKGMWVKFLAIIV